MGRSEAIPVGPLHLRLHASVAPEASRTRFHLARSARSLFPAPAEPAVRSQSLKGWSRVSQNFWDPLMCALTNPQGPGYALGTASASPGASPGDASPWLPRTRGSWLCAVRRGTLSALRLHAPRPGNHEGSEAPPGQRHPGAPRGAPCATAPPLRRPTGRGLVVRSLPKFAGRHMGRGRGARWAGTADGGRGCGVSPHLPFPRRESRAGHAALGFRPRVLGSPTAAALLSQQTRKFPACRSADRTAGRRRSGAHRRWGTRREGGREERRVRRGQRPGCLSLR